MRFHVSLVCHKEGKRPCVQVMLMILELLALYKEVQEYYDAGKLNVPEDVTLLFADDNFGTIRRLPSLTEQGRKGGAGVSTPPLYAWRKSLTSAGNRFITILNMSDTLEVTR